MKNVLCYIYEKFVDFETVFTCSYLNEMEDYNLVYIAYDKAPIISSGGLKIIPDKTVSEISDGEDIYGLLIPGGSIREFKPELMSLIQKLNGEKKLIAAICAAPEFLAKSGILNDKKYTTSLLPEYYEEKKEIDPFPRDNYIESRIVKDSNLITAKGHAFVDFALEIWDYFGLYENKDEIEQDKLLLTPS
ncbi:MAG: DJ-1/PfpI family protein [Candidatus Heimdallarchaeota archaeon]